jgi:hypothetical protein
MTTKKKNHTNKKLISNKKNSELMSMLRKHVDNMDIEFEDEKLTKYIYDSIKVSKKHSQSIQYDYSIRDFQYKPLYGGKFISENIIFEIKSKLNLTYAIQFKVKNVTCYANIHSINKIDIEEYIELIKRVLCFCIFQVDIAYDIRFNLDLFLLDKEKSIPISEFNHSVTQDHINSGYSYHDDSMNVVIYRKEEWLKVFIHECFHAFNMDFHEEQILFKNIFEDRFFIKSDFLLYESFVEFWARIFNCAFFTLNLKANMSLNDFHNVFTLNLNIERVHSIMQANKLLSIFQIDYDKITDEKYKNICMKLYKEETNAFCYYVITALMMCNFKHTIQWFDVHNQNAFVFDKEERQVLIFCHYIKQLAAEPNVKAIFKKLNDVKLSRENHMKMCIFEVNI